MKQDFRAALLAANELTGLVNVTIAANAIELKTSSSTGGASVETIDCSFECAPISFAANARLLIDAAGAMDSEMIESDNETQHNA